MSRLAVAVIALGIILGMATGFGITQGNVDDLHARLAAEQRRVRRLHQALDAAETQAAEATAAAEAAVRVANEALFAAALLANQVRDLGGTPVVTPDRPAPSPSPSPTPAPPCRVRHPISGACLLA